MPTETRTGQDSTLHDKDIITRSKKNSRQCQKRSERSGVQKVIQLHVGVEKKMRKEKCALERRQA